MKIRYTGKRLNSNLFIGIAWAIFSLLIFIYNGVLRWMDYGYIVLAIIYLGQYFFEYQHQYLTIKRGMLIKNRWYWFGQQIQLNEITRIKSFAGEYTLISERGTMTINTQLIDKVSLIDLKNILAELNLPTGNTPFTDMG